METIIQEITQKIIKETKENLVNTLMENKDISEFILSTKKMLDEIGVKIVKEALEAVDYLVKYESWRKENWTVERKDKKTIATIFGEVKYKRTYYKNKKTGEYKYLSDERLGIEVHDRLDSSLKAKLIDEAIDSSYRKSGEEAVDSIDLTNQTVMNTIRELGNIPNDSVKIRQKKKVVKILYIEADEDHVALQTGKSVQAKLVYVHEGKKAVNKNRYSLRNVRYFSGIYSNSADLWIEVANYLEEAYDMEKVEKIYLSGDGAKWIKEGLGWIKNSIFVLDRFHLSKYVKIATAHMPHTTPIMWHYINKLDKKAVLDLFDVIIEDTKSETKVKTIKEARRYIKMGWEGIKNQYNEDYVGCSAEGHVSHILADRLSSRPLAWSKKGVDQMARLRVFKANGGNIYDLVKRKKKEKQKELRLNKISRRNIQKIMKKSANEKIDNITILNIGKRTWLSEMLKSIRGA